VQARYVHKVFEPHKRTWRAAQSARTRSNGGNGASFGTLPLEIVLRTLRDRSNTLLFEASDKTPTFEEDLDYFVSNLFAKRREVIPTPSEWLNIAFGGAGSQASYTR